MARQWIGTGPDFRIEWGPRTWVLNVDGPHPGLQLSEGDAGPLLGLDGVAASERSAPSALSGATLTGFERRFDRVEATYAPLGWGGLSVRAAWNPSGIDAMDLEIQISAPSVDQLKALEVRVASVLPEPSKPASAPSVKRWVEPRDARSAGLSYDGREGDARGLTTLPPVLDESLAPRVLPSPWAKGEFYVEIAHPQDTSRRITESSRFSSLGHTTRYGLFGHDLERGVVLRARLRGLWIESDAPEAESLRRLDRFLREPLPLGI